MNQNYQQNNLNKLLNKLNINYKQKKIKLNSRKRITIKKPWNYKIKSMSLKIKLVNNLQILQNVKEK